MFILGRGRLMMSRFLAIIVQVLRRRRDAQTVEKLRGDIMRTEDPTVTAATLTEQIEKRGEHGWIEPLIEAMGTWMLMQLGDMASLLEVILKYVPNHMNPHDSAHNLALHRPARSEKI